MPICVKNEIGKLKRVMLHRPGAELEKLIPGELERLLFDDIPYLKTAQQEHDIFAGILRGNDVDVVYLEDLMAETLQENPEIKEQFIKELIVDAGAQAHQEAAALQEYLKGIQNEKELVLKTMSGVYHGKWSQHQPHVFEDEKPGDNLRKIYHELSPGLQESGNSVL